MKPKNLVYFGSPEFSAATLKSLIQTSSPKFKVVGVVTSPDKPLGRKQIPTPSPVAQLAAQYDLPVFKPEKLNDAHLAHLKLLKPDLFLVVSYGKIIPNSWLFAPTIGTFNLHFSLLPKYRGALCTSEAIKNQDRETGVTLMVMDEGMDTGPIISQSKMTIDIDDDNETLTNKLTQAGIKLLAEYLPLLARRSSRLRRGLSTLSEPSVPALPRTLDRVGAIRQLAHPQDETQATYTPTTKTRNRQTAFIPWNDIKCAMSDQQCAPTMHALIRSLNPDPGALTRIPVLSGQETVTGEIEIKIIKTRLDTKYLILDTIQLPGKNPIPWKNFLSGHPG